MNKQTKQAIGFLAIAGVLIWLYKTHQKNKAAVAPAALPQSSTPDSAAANFVAATYWLVGDYDPLTNTTYVYPEGNLGGGKKIAGYAKKGTRFQPSSAVV